MASDTSIFGSAVVPFRLTFLMWATFYLESFIHLPLIVFGIEPRTFHGLIGIFTAPTHSWRCFPFDFQYYTSFVFGVCIIFLL